jgi:repressor LexA
MNILHPTQEKLLRLLEDTIDEPLTIRELQDRLGLSSPSLVQHHIQQLEKKGFLKRNPDNPQDYHLLKNPERPVVYLNLYGLAQCGPNGSILDGAVIDRIPISTKLLSFPASEAFLVQARGDSMKPLIREGDIVIARKTSTVNVGKLVVCVNNGEALIKRLYRTDDYVLLESENRNYNPIVASKDDFRIEGEVKSVISPIN